MSGAGRRHHRELLVSDLDGTLLRPDAALSAFTVSVINEYLASGGLFTYATARSYTSAARVTAPLRLRLPVMTYGGAVVVDPVTGQARQAQLLPAALVEEVFRLTDGSRLVQPIVYAIREGRDRACWLADRITPGVASFLRARPGDPRLLPLSHRDDIDAASVFYVSLIGDRQPLHELFEQLSDALGGCHVVLAEDVYSAGQWWLELTSTTKAAAVAALKAEVAAETVTCFGDQLNDLPMFAVADTALAVANAAPEVRAAATQVIGANTDDGVARWIAATLTSAEMSPPSPGEAGRAGPGSCGAATSASSSTHAGVRCGYRPCRPRCAT
ncbi:HAD family hydrolase [Dactylosporangium salmoneum]|uniref:Cof-type HAD-IIB family hydrolase n=1 Tax=Dactylosporangium salmoneum TaxID=53361 RepID=A0ABP5TVT5_9ACTN